MTRWNGCVVHEEASAGPKQEPSPFELSDCCSGVHEAAIKGGRSLLLALIL